MTRISENRPWIQRGAVRPRAVCLWLLAGFITLQFVRPAVGQTSLALQPDFTLLAESEQSVDRSLLLWLNGRTNGAFVATMKVADASFYPLVFGSVPVYWVATMISDEVPSSEALSFSVGWAATAGSTLLLKRLIGKQRPYVSSSVSDLDLVIRYTQAELDELGTSSSMPSGHASMSVFAASFVAMQIDTPAAYTVGGLWASSVAVSRVWNGVHFPSDIAAGAILGVTTALIVRHFE